MAVNVVGDDCWGTVAPEGSDTVTPATWSPPPNPDPAGPPDDALPDPDDAELDPLPPPAGEDPLPVGVLPIDALPVGVPAGDEPPDAPALWLGDDC